MLDPALQGVSKNNTTSINYMNFFFPFDLLRICVYSFSSFVRSFLEEFPDYFISPVRLSGSAVETLFSQFKHTSGGKLSSLNYVTARAAHLIKHTVAYHHSSVSYRDVPLHLSDTMLQKMKYRQKKETES